MEKEFEELYQKWLLHCEQPMVRLMSSSSPRHGGEAYNAMVKMGKAIIPFILKKFKTDLSRAHFLYDLMERITGAVPDDPNYTHNQNKCAVWLKRYEGDDKKKEKE